MRFAHVQPVVVGFVTGGVLAASATGFSVTAPAMQASLPGTATAELTVTTAAAGGTGQQCEPLQLPAPSPSPTPTQTGPTATPSTSTTSPGAGPSTSPPTGTPTPSGSASPSPTADSPPSPTPSASASGSVSPSASTASPTTSSGSPSATPSATTGTSPAPTTTPKPSGSPTTSITAIAFTSPAATQPPQVSLCVAVQPAQSSIERGRTAEWTVSAWTRGGNVPDATVRLQAAPAGMTSTFSFGCGSHDGTASCDLGAVDAKSAQRQLRAQIAVAASATRVTSVRLTAIATAAHLPKNPQASATVTVTAAPAAPAGLSTPATITSPLPVGNLPYLPSASPMLSPGGNAAGLFPVLTPAADPPSGQRGAQQGNTRPVADTSALPLGAPVVGAQLAGLGALGLAFVLVVARLSLRRRPAVASAAEPQKPAAGPPAPTADDDTLES